MVITKILATILAIPALASLHAGAGIAIANQHSWKITPNYP